MKRKPKASQENNLVPLYATQVLPQKNVKEHKVSFRMENGLYESLKGLAKFNETSLSKLIVEMLTQHISDLQSGYFAAQFIKAAPKSLELGVTAIEKALPRQFRQFTNATEKYQNAAPLDHHDITMHFLNVSKEFGINIAEINKEQADSMTENIIASLFQKEEADE